VLAGQCGIPASAEAVSVNVTAVPLSWGGFMTLWPADGALPATSTINFGPGQVRANNAILTLGRAAPYADAIAVLPGLAGAGEVHLVVDVNGYFD
jgi:hypothetical protein